MFSLFSVAWQMEPTGEEKRSAHFQSAANKHECPRQEASLLWMMCGYLTLVCLDPTPNTQFCQWIDTDHRFWNYYFKILREKTYIAFKNMWFGFLSTSSQLFLATFGKLLQRWRFSENFSEVFTVTVYTGNQGFGFSAFCLISSFVCNFWLCNPATAD